MTNYRTAECVSPGHPDKICDQISDAILDAHLNEDPAARVAIDVAGGHGMVFVTGEVSSKSKLVDVPKIIHGVAPNVKVIENIAAQSPEIAQGVDTGGAGDQGIMVGYACNDTEELLPIETVLSRKLNQYLYSIWPHDGKTQVTLKNGKITSIVASFQHAKSNELKDAISEWLRSESIVGTVNNLEFHCNPAGDWTQGGFDADAGLTGRKLVVDNYGPRIPIGGGAFSGKDPSKVDRSAAYMARYIARQYLKNHNAKEVFVHIAYAIGYSQPLEATVTINGKQAPILDYDLSPNAIIAKLNLRQPIYKQTARWGHFGHAEFPWEV